MWFWIQVFLLLEARVREIYYGCYDAFLLSDAFQYQKRSRRPPQNAFNAMLSFGNTVLYNLIATEINKSALDIRIGFLHATNRRLQSLNLDIAELFKPLVVDRTIITEKYLQPVQRSVFEGHLTEHALKRLQGELLNILDCEEDSVLIYKQDFNGELTRLQLGSRQMAAGMIL